ncbi:MAG TPA: hypothetical protein V6C69_00830 [Trichormus sp.]|jgi:hypothetical protein
MRSISWLGISLFIAGACAFTAQPRAFAKAMATKDQAWMLQQNSDQYGVVSTIVGRDAVHMTTADFAMGISAPKYDLVMMNTETKRYMVRPASEYDALGRRQLFDKRMLAEVKKGKTAKICGLNATQYLLQRKGALVTLEWWCTEDLNTSEPLNRACARFTGLSGISSTGFLLRYSHTNAAGRRYVYLDTIGVKKVDPATLKFKVPPSYKKVMTAMELIAPNDGEDIDTSGIAGTMGDGKGHK